MFFNCSSLHSFVTTFTCEERSQIISFHPFSRRTDPSSGGVGEGRDRGMNCSTPTIIPACPCLAGRQAPPSRGRKWTFVMQSTHHPRHVRPHKKHNPAQA